MKKLFLTGGLYCLAVGIACAALDTAKIDNLTGLKGKLNEKEGVYKITFPRNDVKVAIDGWTMPPFMGLGTWAAFTKGAQTEAMVMGDTVLFEDEVNPVMSAALDSGLSVTALHNHFFFDHPKVYFMHIEGRGTVDQLATAVRKPYDKIKEVRAARPQPKDSFGSQSLPEKNSISPEPLDGIFGMSGEVNNGMVKFTIGRPDYAVTEDELQPALKALRAGGINIVAIHSHMTHENPRILFLHYWGRGSAKKLAEVVKGALLVTGLSGVTTPAGN